MNSHPSMTIRSRNLQRLRSLTPAIAGLFAATLAAFGLSACGGSTLGSGANSVSSTASSCTSASCGTALMSLTDAPGDFLTYTVNVVSLNLQRADGTVVETLPVTTTVDFATLVSLSEIVSAGQIPAGRYTSATMTLDYTNANIVVDNGTAAGEAVTAVDSSGAALGLTTLTVQFNGANALVVTPGIIANLSLDFNLAATNTVNLTTAKVTVNPVLVASLVPSTTRPFRVRGSLVSVDSTAGTYTVNLRPFHDDTDADGQEVVATTSATTYVINGTSYAGGAGLTQLAGLAPGTMVVAFGSLSTADHSFTASTVRAGSSAVSMTQQSVEGDVVARSGNVLTVRNATLTQIDDRECEFERGDVTVTVGTGTTVTKDGYSGSFTIQDISVGQHVRFLGTLTQGGGQPPPEGSSSSSSSGSSGGSSSSSSSSGSSSSSSSSGGSSSSGSSSGAMVTPTNLDMNSGSVAALDATAGSAELMLTSLWGTTTAIGSNSVTIDLQEIDGRSAAAFNFAGTGTASANDAVASAYMVGTSGLSLSGLMTNMPVRFLGFVAPFGSVASGGVDFNATTLVNFAQADALVLIHWGSGGLAAVFSSVTPGAVTVPQSALDASADATLLLGPQSISLVSAAGHTTGLTLTPPSSAVSAVQYAIAHLSTGKTDSYGSFADFATALQSDLTAGSTLTSAIAARGPYDTGTSALSAVQAIVLLSN